MNVYFNPVRTYQGSGALHCLPELVRQAAPADQRILLLIWDEAVLRQAAFQTLLHGDAEERIVVRRLSCSNPELEQLYAMYEQTRAMQIGLVIAVGGGSVLDVGKSLCCLYNENLISVEELRTLIAEKRIGKPVCRWIGVPTTAGTGSEVTCWATVWDSPNDVKYSVDTQGNYAYAAVVDPMLAKSMPVGLAISSALDAAAHATESYWAKASNAVSRGLALTAIQTIMGQIDALLEHPEDERAHDAMARGSLIAGLAFSNTRTTACHSISYPLTMRYHIPHGVAVSLLLGPVMELNAPQTPALSALLSAYGITTPAALRGRVNSILQAAGYPLHLRDWGAVEADFPELIAHSMTKGRADNNPVELTEAVVHNILSTIL